MAEDKSTKSSKSSLVSTYLSRMMLALRAGLMFQGARDVYNVFGYTRIITWQHLHERYLRQDIAGRLVDLPAKALWTAPPTLEGPAELVKAWNDLVANGEIWSEILRADMILGFDEYAVLVFGLPGEIETAPQTKGNKIFFIRAVAGHNAQIKQLNSDMTSADFGNPIAYQLSLTGEDTSSLSKTVHADRVVHLVNEDPLDRLKSAPRLVRVNNLLDDLLKVAGGSAETFWLTANRGMQADIDKDMEIDAADAAALSDELEEFQHQLRRFVRTRGVKINNLGTDVADPTGVFRVIISLLSSASGIPQRILIGAEAGQLASEQDRANWSYEVDRRRKYFGEPCVLRPIVRKLQKVGILPMTDESFTFKWPEAFLMSPLEKGQAMAQQARAVANLSRQGQLGAPVTSVEEARVICGLPREMPSGDTPVPFIEELKDDILEESSADTGSETGMGEASSNPEDPEQPLVDAPRKTT